MSLPEGQLEQLQNEQIKGGQAQHAYDSFIHDFCEKKRMSLFQAFSDLPLSDTENLIEVKRMLYAVDTLETEILTVIDTGKLASEVLNKHEKEVTH